MATETTTQPTSNQRAIGKLVLTEDSRLVRIDVACDLQFSCTPTLSTLSDTPALYSWPSWSFDGQHIVFGSDLEGSTDTLAVFTALDNGTHLQRIATAGHDPAWSPVADAIAYGSWEGGGRIELALLNGQESIAVESPFASHPVWSPDGSRIAYTAGESPSQSLFVLDLSTSRAQELARGATGHISWSPRGNRLVFTMSNDDAPGLYLVDMPSQDRPPGPAHRLTELGAVTDPVWSPDGTSISFLATAAGNTDIYVLGSDCIEAPAQCPNSPRPLITTPENEYSPTWFPDSFHLVFSTGSQGSWRIVLAPINDPARSQVLAYLSSPSQIDAYLYP